MHSDRSLAICIVLALILALPLFSRGRIHLLCSQMIVQIRDMADLNRSGCRSGCALPKAAQDTVDVFRSPTRGTPRTLFGKSGLINA